MGSFTFRKNILLSDTEISTFCHQLCMVVKAGLPIHYGISILRDQAMDEKTHKIYTQLHTPLEQGGSLYSAISQMHCFPTYMVEMIHLGEETGRLDDVLSSLSSYYEREHLIRSNIRHTLIYPMVMTYFMIIVLAIILSQIVPVFSNLYLKLLGELSGLGLTMLKISNLLNDYSTIFIIFMILLIILCIAIYRSTFGKTLYQGKRLAMSIARSRFANSMHMSLASGLDTQQSLELSIRLVDNPYMAAKIDRCLLDIRHGETFVTALLHSGVFSRMYSGLLLIGAKTGSMVDVMKTISQSYEDDTDRMLKRGVLILEPTLILILSIFIGLILFTFVVPLLNILL